MSRPILKLLNPDTGQWFEIPAIMGKSAYQSYVDNGGTLTEAEWVASLAQGAPTFVDSIDEMTDISKAYVLTTDGMIYKYGTKEVVTHHNSYDPSTATFNKRIGSSGTESTWNGLLLLPYEEVTLTDPYTIKISGVTLVLNYSTLVNVCYFDSDKLYLGTENGSLTGGNLSVTLDDNGIYTANIYRSTYASAKYVRVRLGIKEKDDAGISAADCEGLVVEFVAKSGVTTETGWFSTGMAYAPAEYEGRIIALETTGIDHEGRIHALESGAVETVPAYWQAAIDDLSDAMAVRQSSGNNAFQFVWFSDFHGKQTKTQNIGVVSQRVCEQYNIPFVATSGDIMSQAAWDDVAEVHAEYVGCNEVFAAIDKDRFLATIGNHDGGWGAAVNGVSYLKDIGNKVLYNKVFRRQATDVKRVFGDDGTYFYVDSHPQKMRFVMLNFHTDGDGSTDGNGYAVYNSCKAFVLGTEQIQWLENVALSVPSGWGIVLMGHPNLSSGEIKDKQLLIDIIAAFNGKTSYAGASVDVSGTYWGNGLTSQYNTTVSVTKDFSNATGEIIAYFHGHIHKDVIDTTTLAVPMIAITTAGGDVRDTDAPARVVGTATETAMDIVTIDRSARKIYMTRLGAGQGTADREVSY